MTRSELHALDSYTQDTYGRAIGPDSCACCGQPPKDGELIAYEGLCQSCRRRSRPDTTVLQLFRPLRMPKRG